MIVDVDDADYLNEIKHIIEECSSGFDKNIICTVQTKSGYHLITHPFNIKEYNDKMKLKQHNVDIPEIKKNHITLLYENL